MDKHMNSIEINLKQFYQIPVNIDIYQCKLFIPYTNEVF